MRTSNRRLSFFIVISCLITAWTAVVAAHTNPLRLEGGGSVAVMEAPGSATGEVIVTNGAFLELRAVITFDDGTAGGELPGTSHDAILRFCGVSIGERFEGQVLDTLVVEDSTMIEYFDALLPAQTVSMELAVGHPSQNLNVFMYEYDTYGQVLTGLGPLGHPLNGAIGEGCFAVLFDQDQSEFGFDLVGGDGFPGRYAWMELRRRDGTLIEGVALMRQGDCPFGFKRRNGENDIAGFSITNDDPAGIGFDNLRFSAGATLVQSESWGGIKSLYR